jgi:hypothetical protein
LCEFNALKEAVKEEAPHEEFVLSIGKDLGHGNGFPLATRAFPLFPLVYLDC